MNEKNKVTLTRHFNINRPEENDTPNDTALSVKSPPAVHTDLKPPSTFYPTHSKGHFIETFSSLVTNDLRTINKHIPIKHNMTKEEKNALQNLKDNDDIIIKSADKGGGTKKDYILEAY